MQQDVQKNKAVKKTKEKSGATTLNSFYRIVGIGASAGGLEAVKEIFKNLPEDTGMAYVYVQHLDPDHKSILTELLGRVTHMKVQQAKNKMQLRENHVYIIPPNKDMVVEDKTITLSKRKPKPAIHLPIDKFFLSLAENKRGPAIGIILSGNGSDGAIGLKAIKSGGGITFAQDDSAKFRSMPQSAISEGIVDFVFSPKEIAKELQRISKQSQSIKINVDEEPQPEKNDEQNNEKSLPDIIHLLRKSVGVDFSNYKMNTIKRRIIRRMVLYKLDHLKDYYQYLLRNVQEINVLYQDLLINVTSFFRDPDLLEYLKKMILPKKLKSKSPQEPLRLWVPACSSGEEAYSLAMIIIETMEEQGLSNIPIQLFASDLSDISIAKARNGLYSKSELLDVSPKRLSRFFTKIDGGYRVIKLIRDICVFAPHNIFKEPPFTRLDFISCCNLMIYMDAVLQKKIINTFHYALNPSGYLILGKSETVNASPQLFFQSERKYKIYSRKNETNTNIHFEGKYKMVGLERTERYFTKQPLQKTADTGVYLDKIVDAILVAEHAPASVVISNDMEILQFRGSTGLFLEPSPGKASLNLLKMARQDLVFELRNAVHKAETQGQPVLRTGLEIKYKGNIHIVSIEVAPLRLENEEQLYLVIFKETPGNGISTARPSVSKDKLVKKLEADLLAAKDDMSSVIEQQEATNEELQAANEEVTSSNEELQSINEELETSKEEVESTNEELLAINNELQVRNEQLSESYEYSEAVLELIQESVLVLNEDLEVKFANRAFYRTFQTDEPATVDTNIYELGNGQWNIPTLRDLLHDVKHKDAEIKNFEVNHYFRKIGEKSMILNARRIVQKTHKQKLILVAFEDITEHRAGQKIILEREAWLRNMTDNLDVLVWVLDSNLKFTFVNRVWYNYTGQKLQQPIQINWDNLVHPNDLETFKEKLDDGFQNRASYSFEYRMRMQNGEYHWLSLVVNPYFSGTDSFLGLIGTASDIQNQKLFVQELEERVRQRTVALQEANQNLQISNDELRQFAYVASHDLQEPLRKIMTFANLVVKYNGERKPDDLKLYLERIVEASKRMSRLINDLLNFSRSTRNNEDFADVNLYYVLSDVMKDFDLSEQDEKIKIEMDKAIRVKAIPIQLHQLFHNLLSNAIKFSAMNPDPLILVSGRRLSRDETPNGLDNQREYVEIQVKDNGIGFEQQYAEQIFVIFQRLHDKQTFPGTGIGLALCKKIVANQGGLLYARSVPGQGATFFVVLPVI